MVFFGTPHNGMQVEEMIMCAQGQPGEFLARDLRPESSMVKQLKERFARASQELKVISCYETRETPTVILNDKGNYSRTGPKKLMVPESSACLFWPDGIETRIPIDANHSMIAKLSNGIESKYHDIRKSIAGIAKDAVMQVRSRFVLPEVYEALERTCYLLRFIAKRTNKLEDSVGELLLHISRRAEAIHSTLTHGTLGAAILGAQSGRRVVTSFAEKTFQLAGIFSPYEAVARERDPEYSPAWNDGPSTMNRIRRVYQVSERKVCALFNSDSIAAVLDQARYIMQALVQTLSISMLREPVGQDMLESHSPTRMTGLHRIAAMQAMMLSGDLEEPQSSLQGSLSVSSSDSRNGVDGLVTGRYSEGDGRPAQLVLVEYKIYARPRSQYLRGMSEDEEKQAAVTKDLAQKLASLLRKSSLEAGDADQTLREFDATTSTFQCLGYKDDVENSRLAFLYKIPEAGVARGLTLSSGVKTLRQLIAEGLKIPLERKFQLAFNICSTVLNLHCSGWVHKSIRSENVILIPKADEESEAPDGDYDVYLKGFEFSRKAVGKSNPFESSRGDDLYRHPDRQGLPDKRFTKEYDIYAVGLVLLEIGTGRSLEHLSDVVKTHMRRKRRPENAQEYREGFRLLADVNTRNTMGTKYARTVVKCLDGAVDGFGVYRDDSKHEMDLALAFQQQVVWEIAPGIHL
ncbi:hypothetical protein F4861DRAFT_181789 [Xylaria intraflava]|nr:hypothetical protein F4861DRAFT_181789 [Xylaria intraflava]